VLAELDAVTRARVINWAAERFGGVSPKATPPEPSMRRTATAGAPLDDDASIDAEDALSVSTLDEFFDLCDAQEPGASSLEVNDALDGPSDSVAGMVHDFVSEFQAIVKQWNGACEEVLDPQADRPATKPEPAAAEPRLSLVTRCTPRQRASKAV
jgi:hypothetical protein